MIRRAPFLDNSGSAGKTRERFRVLIISTRSFRSLNLESLAYTDLAAVVSEAYRDYAALNDGKPAWMTADVLDSYPKADQHLVTET